MSTSFPLANHTFTVTRKAIGSKTAEVISTGLSMLLEFKNGWVETGKEGMLQTSIYDGTCSKNAGLFIGDVLIDEAELNLRGEAISYNVQVSFVDALFTNVILHRNDS